MTRPLHLSTGATELVSLFVRRDYIEGTPSRCWRLYWATHANANRVMPDASTVTSPAREVHFPTMRDAIAFGEKRHGETAARMED